ncbi:MAG: hypothetical protein K1060chlam2_01412, partial [Chlamydiae bacterium]|nr:hypothetical protein [Chlamydiota bacterium]
ITFLNLQHSFQKENALIHLKLPDFHQEMMSVHVFFGIAMHNPWMNSTLEMMSMHVFFGIAILNL